MRKQVISLGEDLNGRFRRAMRQEFRSPVEEVGLGRAQFRGTLVLLYGFERVAQFFLDIAEKVMQFSFFLSGLVLNSLQCSKPRASILMVTSVRMGVCQGVGSFVITRTELGCAIEIGKCFP